MMFLLFTLTVVVRFLLFAKGQYFHVPLFVVSCVLCVCFTISQSGDVFAL